MSKEWPNRKARFVREPKKEFRHHTHKKVKLNIPMQVTGSAALFLSQCNKIDWNRPPALGVLMGTGIGWSWNWTHGNLWQLTLKICSGCACVCVCVCVCVCECECVYERESTRAGACEAWW